MSAKQGEIKLSKIRQSFLHSTAKNNFSNKGTLSTLSTEQNNNQKAVTIHTKIQQTETAVPR